MPATLDARQTIVRCVDCKRRLVDFENQIVTGRLVIEIICRCGKRHEETVKAVGS